MDTKWEYHGKRISLCYLMTEPSQWQHVQTGENPADLCTRGATPDELLESSLWWHGPRWLLSEDKAAWPRMNVRSCPASLPELKTSDRKEGEDVAHVLTCRQQSPMNRGRGGAKPKCQTGGLNPHAFQVGHA